MVTKNWQAYKVISSKTLFKQAATSWSCYSDQQLQSSGKLVSGKTHLLQTPEVPKYTPLKSPLSRTPNKSSANWSWVRMKTHSTSWPMTPVTKGHNGTQALDYPLSTPIKQLALQTPKSSRKETLWTNALFQMQATVHSFVWAKLKALCQAPGNPLLKQSFNQTITSNPLQVVLTLQQ